MPINTDFIPDIHCLVATHRQRSDISSRTSVLDNVKLSEGKVEARSKKDHCAAVMSRRIPTEVICACMQIFLNHNQWREFSYIWRNLNRVQQQCPGINIIGAKLPEILLVHLTRWARTWSNNTRASTSEKYR